MTRGLFTGQLTKHDTRAKRSSPADVAVAVKVPYGLTGSIQPGNRLLIATDHRGIGIDAQASAGLTHNRWTHFHPIEGALGYGFMAMGLKECGVLTLLGVVIVTRHRPGQAVAVDLDGRGQFS